MASEKGNSVLLEVTRATLLVRMLSLLLAVLTPDRVTIGSLVGQLMVAAITLAWMVSPRARDLVMKHPALVLVGASVLAGVALVSGGDTPFVLTFMTTAVLVGLWASPWTGGAILMGLAALCGAVWSRMWSGGILQSLLLPFVFVLLWWLGYAIQQSGAAERRSRRALQQAITVAAASEERTRLAREMHDTLAKSLQAIHLTAAALPVLIERDPAISKDHARELQELSVQAIGDARALMSSLRRQPEGDCLPEMVRQVCQEWQEGSGVEVALSIDATIEVTDQLVRYELLMALGEALENVRRHAKASRVQVSLGGASAEMVEIAVRDNGVGVAQERLDEAEKTGHFGRRGMRERVEKVGGTLTFESTPGTGTSVVLRAPKRGLVEQEGAAA